MPCANSRPSFFLRLPIHVLTCLLAALVPLAVTNSATGQNIIRPLSTDPNGQTPSIIGLNSGNWVRGNNSATFWRWTGVNGSRTFTSAPNIEQEDDIPGQGDGVVSQASFMFRRSLVRANPTNPGLINFAEFEDGYRNNLSDFIDYDYAYSQYRENGIQALALINRTEGQFPFAEPGTANAWGDWWEHWQHYYAQAYYLGSNHNVERYSMYNEPDQSSQDVTQADYLVRLQLASDAIQSALEDVNRDFGKNLQPNIIAPITAGSANEYFRRLDNSDTRDDDQGWGELVINNLNTNFLGQVDPNFQLVHTYGYQQYNANGREYASDLDFIKDSTRDDIRDNNLVGDVGFALTEFNVHSNGVFETRSDDLNTPSRFARLGGIFTGLTNEEVDELYVFKFDSNAMRDFQGNAVFTNSQLDSPFNVGGATKAAGVLKLFTKGFAGGHDLIRTSETTNNLDVATSFHQEKDMFFILSANESSGTDRNLTFDLSELGIETGAMVQIEEVAEGHLAEVTLRVPLPADGIVTFEQERQTVLLLSVPRTAADQQLTLTATDDATVRAANNSGGNFNGSNNIFVRNVADAADAGGRAAGVIQFDGSSIIDSTAVERALLRVHGEINEGRSQADYVTTHVYGIVGDDWDADSVRWNNVDNLAESTGDATRIRDNFVAGVGQTAEFLGHLTFSDDTEDITLDVTDYVKQAAGQNIQFLVVREVRFDGENVDRAFGATRFDSTENSSGMGPQLLLELRNVTPPSRLGDFDMDGDVDLADLDRYNGNIDAAATGDLAEIDLNGNNIVDLSDFAEHYGALVETSNGGIGTAVGDINLDGIVDVLGDAFELVSNLGSSATSWSQGDLNGDGVVDVLGDAFLLIASLGADNGGAQ